MARLIKDLQTPFTQNSFYDTDNLYPQPLLKSSSSSSPASSSSFSSNSWPKKVLKLTQNKPSLGGATMSTSKKLVLVGDQAVGKTTLAKRYTKGTKLTNFDYKATIGIDFECIKYNILNIPFTVQLWDTAGQERFRAMSSQYYRKAKVVFIVADATNSKSIANIEGWNRHVEENVDDIDECFKFLVLTKD